MPVDNRDKILNSSFLKHSFFYTVNVKELGPVIKVFELYFRGH